MLNKNLELLKNLSVEYIYLLVVILIKNGNSKIIQQAVVDCGIDIVVDGIIGYKTIKAILTLKPDTFVGAINDVYAKKDKKELDKLKETNEEYLMSYLASAEGLTVHWNKKESNFTTPYGVYAKSFPNSEPVVYVRSLFLKYKLPVNRVNSKKINKLLTREERENIRKFCYNFYLKNFMDKRVSDELGKKSSLSYFSISVNGGMPRGNKAVQTTLRTIVDGVIGKLTIRLLKSSKLSDEEFNISMLKYMKDFYLMLIRINPKRYAINKRGWMNRLKALA